MTFRTIGTLGLFVLAAAGGAVAEEIKKRGDTSYMPVDIKESFASIMKRMKGDKPNIERRHRELLEKRYDLSNRPVKGATMFRGKLLQQGPRAKLAGGVTWSALGSMSPEQIRQRNVFPRGLQATSASESSGRRHGLSQVPHRRGEAAGRTRLDPLRS